MEMPDWFGPALEAARLEDRKARLAAMPPVKFLFGDRWGYSPDCRSFGIMWDKDPEPDEGSYIYRRKLILHITFRISLEH